MVLAFYIFRAQASGRAEVVAGRTRPLVDPLVDGFGQVGRLPHAAVVVDEQLAAVVERDLVAAIGRIAGGRGVDKGNLENWILVNIKCLKVRQALGT